MKIIRLLTVAFLLLLPQCTRIMKQKAFQPVQTQSKELIEMEPLWKESPPVPGSTKIPQEGLTLEGAIALSLNHNPTIQARFEEIGIKKSDLVQAGLYTNPYLQSVFRIPKREILRTNIEVLANFTLSDLWQVPLRKKVAQDKLCVTTHEIVNDILTLRHTVQNGYLTCLFHQKHLALNTEIMAALQTVKEQTEYRFQFGFGNDITINQAESRLAERGAQVIEAERMLQQSFIALYELLGESISSTPISLIDPISAPCLNRSETQFTDTALRSHPQILMAQARIAETQHSITYERSRIIDQVQVGVAYERDFEKLNSGVGPWLGVSVPLFNTNYGAIERAKSTCQQAEKDLVAQKQTIRKEIMTHYLNYSSALDQIEKFKKAVIPPIIHAIESSKHLVEQMQLSTVAYLEKQIELLEAKLKLHHLTYKAAQEYADLELAAGIKIQDLIHL